MQAQRLRLRGERTLRVLIGEAAAAASCTTVFLIHGAYLPVPLLERLRPKLSAGFRAAAWGPDAPSALVNDETAISDTNSLYVFKALWRQWLQLDAVALRGVTVPLHLLAGEADLLTPPDGARRLAALLRHAQLRVLPGCGHQIPIERPAWVLETILANAPGGPMMPR